MLDTPMIYICIFLLGQRCYDLKLKKNKFVETPPCCFEGCEDASQMEDATFTN
jgi:hypothetical protein